MAEQVPINPNGPKITAEIRIGYAQEGAYVLTLWEKNEVKQRWEGNFLDPEDDTYPLPGTAKSQVGRLLQCRAEIGMVPGIQKWALTVTVWQGNLKVGAMSDSGEADAGTILVPVNLFGRLVAA